jgi:Zn-dependent protease
MLMLRVGVAASLHIDPSGHFAVHPNIPAFVALATLSGSLVVGLLTPFVSLLAGIVEVALLLMGATSVAVAVLLGPLDAVVLLLLGPGAYSLDARLFGRRVVVLQPTPSPTEPS